MIPVGYTSFLQQHTVISGQNQGYSWQVLILGVLILLALFAGLLLIFRRARRLAQSDEGESWTGRHSLVGDSKSEEAVAEPVQPAAAPDYRAAPQPKTEPAPEPVKVALAAAPVPAQGAPQRITPIEPAREELEPAPPPGEARTTSLFSAMDRSASRSSKVRAGILVLFVLVVGSLLLSANLRESLRSRWDSIFARLTQSGNPAAPASPHSGLTTLPALDVAMNGSAVTMAGGKRSVTVQVRVRNVSSDTYAEILAEMALTPPGSHVSETRLVHLEPGPLRPNEELEGTLKFGTDEFTGYQITRMLTPDGKEVTFRLTNEIPGAGPEPGTPPHPARRR